MKDFTIGTIEGIGRVYPWIDGGDEILLSHYIIIFSIWYIIMYGKDYFVFLYLLTLVISLTYKFMIWLCRWNTKSLIRIFSMEKHEIGSLIVMEPITLCF